MREMSLVARREVIARCVADHNVPLDPEFPRSGEVVVDSARIVSIEPGHDAHDPTTGICPTCGRLSGWSEQYEALPVEDRWKAGACHERADWVVELHYHVVRDTSPEFGCEDREWGAVYGVTLQGDRLDVSCWMD